jgi:hypothetical protein
MCRVIRCDMSDSVVAYLNTITHLHVAFLYGNTVYVYCTCVSKSPKRILEECRFLMLRRVALVRIEGKLYWRPELQPRILHNCWERSNFNT